MSFMRDLGQGARKSGSPVTYGLIAALAAAFVTAWLYRGSFFESLAFMGNWDRPWTIVTYPFADAGNGASLLFFLLMLLWLYWTGTVVERELGSAKYGLFLVAMTLLPWAFIYVGALMVVGKAVPVAGPSLLVAAVTVAWGVRNPAATILLMFVIPLTGKMLAWLTALLTLFGYGSLYGSPMMGVFATLHLAVAAMFAANKVPFVGYQRPTWKAPAAKATDRRDQAYYDDVRRREKDREERERLRKLFEGNAGDEGGNDR